MKIFLVVVSFLLWSSESFSQAEEEREKVLSVVQDFFVALETQDTVLFQSLFIDYAFNHYVREFQDSTKTWVETGTQNPDGFTFKPNRILTERLTGQDLEVKIHKRIAMVWSPYNFWVNEEFSHCGIDVFTMFKTDAGWKISSVSFSVEPSFD
ncbi:MAG: hypothetical protein ABIQ11_04275 [Saprospiraceae bacterium]